MDFERITDLDLVRAILTHPSIYPLVTDDYAPPVAEFNVNAHPDIYYLGIFDDGKLTGMYCLFPQGRICWDLHVVMMPWATPAQKREAARGLVPWLAANTECKRLTGAVPESKRHAVYYAAHGLRMRYVGRQQKAIMMGGRLQDLILFGRSVEV